MFLLEKTYLDLVDADGRSAVLYWCLLGWGPVRVGWHAATLHAPGRLPRHASSLAAAPRPAVDAGRISWRSDSIACEVQGTAMQPPLEAVLLPGDDGLTWRCEAPSAQIRVSLAGQNISGIGYVERLELRRPPWLLPIDELRWGRWIADDGRRSVVWIDWRGDHPCRWRPLTVFAPTGQPSPTMKWRRTVAC